VSVNLDLVRAIYADWERGDFSSLSWAHPQIEWLMIDGPTPGRRTGSGSATREFGRFLSAWDNLVIEADSCRELDDTRVLALTRFRGRGRTSGLELSQVGSEGAHVFHIRDGEVIRIDAYWSRERALADLGLAPEAEENAGPPDAC
jgi:ketosteroid isomerase-like protein